jgi:hypothetical protein
MHLLAVVVPCSALAGSGGTVQDQSSFVAPQVWQLASGTCGDISSGHTVLTPSQFRQRCPVVFRPAGPVLAADPLYQIHKSVDHWKQHSTSVITRCHEFLGVRRRHEGRWWHDVLIVTIFFFFESAIVLILVVTLFDARAFPYRTWTHSSSRLIALCSSQDAKFTLLLTTRWRVKRKLGGVVWCHPS